MKPQRLWWRVLLVLLCGGGTWWLVGWWLSPRPWFEAVYDIREWGKLPKVEHEKAKQINVRATPWTSRAITNVTVLDRQGRYLLVHFQDETSYSMVIDLKTRQPVMQFNNAAHLPTWNSLNDVNGGGMHGDGTLILRVMQRIEEHDHSRPDQFDRQELWSWNLFSGQWMKLRQYSPQVSLVFSADRSTLLEVERRTVMNPSLLLPLQWPSLLAGLAEIKNHYQDVIEYRLYSLPAQTPLCSFTQPSMPNQDRGRLSEDGQYLVFSDDWLPSGFTSTRKLIHIHPIKYLPEYPCASILRTKDGTLVYQAEKQGSNYSYREARDVLSFKREKQTRDKDNEWIAYHIPSQQWLPTGIHDCARLDDKRLHVRCRNNQGEMSYEILDRDGTLTRLTMDKDSVFDQLLPGATQCLRKREESFLDQLPLPDDVRLWMETKPFLEGMTRRKSRGLVKDYVTGRVITILRPRFGNYLQYSLSDQWLTVHDGDHKSLHLAVYPLPFPSWSPWWSRVAGGVVALAMAWLLRRRRVSVS